MDHNAALSKLKIAKDFLNQKKYDLAIKNSKEAIQLKLPIELQIEAKNQIANAYFEISKEAFLNFEKVFEANRDLLKNSKFNKLKITLSELSKSNDRLKNDEIINAMKLMRTRLHTISKNLGFGESYAQDKKTFNSKINSLFKSFYDNNNGEDYFIGYLRILSLLVNIKSDNESQSNEKINPIEQFKAEIQKLLKSSLDMDSEIKEKAMNELSSISYQNSHVNKLFGNDSSINEILKDVVSQSAEENILSVDTKKKQVLENKKAQKNLEKAISELSKGNARQAERYLQEILIEDLVDDLSKEKLAAAYNELGRLFKSGGMYKTTAIKYFEKSLQYTNRMETFIKSCFSIIKRYIDAGDLFHAQDFVSIAEKFNNEAKDSVATLQSLKNDLNERMKAYPADKLLKMKTQFESEKSKNRNNSSIYSALADKLLGNIEQNKNTKINDDNPSAGAYKLNQEDTNNISLNKERELSRNKIKEYLETGRAKLWSGYYDQAIQYFDKANKENLTDKEREQLTELYSEVFFKKAENLRIGKPTDKFEDSLQKREGAIQFYEKCLRNTNNELWFYNSIIGIVKANLYTQPKFGLALEYLNLAQRFSHLGKKNFPLHKNKDRNSEIKQLREHCTSEINSMSSAKRAQENMVIDESHKKKLILYNALADKLLSKALEEKSKKPLMGFENDSRKDKNLEENFNNKVSETLSVDEDVDGWVSIKYFRHGLYMKEIPPKGKGKSPSVQDVLNSLKKREIELPSEETIQSFLLSKSAEYIRIGDSKIKPFAEAEVKIKIVDINSMVYVTLLPPKPGGRDLEIADVVYELRKKDIEYRINEEVIREAIEQEKYKIPFAIVKEDMSGEIEYKSNEKSKEGKNDPFEETETDDNPFGENGIAEDNNEKINKTILNANDFLQQGNFENALEEMNQAIGLGLKLPVVYFNKGYTQFQLHHYEQAVLDYSEAIRLNPIDPEYYNARGRAYFEMEKIMEAIEDFSKAIQIDPEMEMAYLNRGICYSFEKNFDLALKDFLDYEKRNTNDPMLYLERANIKIEQEDLYGAIQDFESYLKLKPDDVDVLYRQALLLFESFEYERAINVCNEILSLQPEWTEAKELRGLIRSKSGDILGAIHDFGYR